MNRHPFRGIYSEIAQEEGVSRQAVQQAARKGNPKILSRIAEKVEERKDVLKRTAGARQERPSRASRRK